MSFDSDVDMIDLSQGAEPVRQLASGIDISEVYKKNTIQAIYDGFKPSFEAYEKILSNLLKEFNSVLNLGKTGSASHTYTFNESNPYLSADSILKENGLENINCKEGEYSYQYYVECIVLKLNELNQYIFGANTALTKLGQLVPRDSMSTDQKIENQAQVLLDQLKMYDSLAFELVKDFRSYYAFTTDPSREEYAEYWEEKFVDFYQVESASSYVSKIGPLSSYCDLEALRQLKVQSYIYDDTNNSSSTSDKELTSFNELTLLDKLKYIYVYYKLDLGSSGASRIIFPNDARFGYPCVPNVVSTTATDETKELGALELFYIGYLIDRDGPINALSSFLEIKAQALRENIAIVMRKISALRQYLSFIRRALELLNTSQADGEKRLPDAAYLALTYISGSVMRNLMELKDAQGNYLRDSQGNEIRDPFIVIQCKDTTTDDGYHLTKTNRYLLVKATEEGIKVFLGNGITGSGDSANSNGKDWGFARTFIGGTNDTIDASQSTSLANAPYTIYDKFTYTRNGDPKSVDTHNADGNIYLLQFSDQAQAKQWLPKEIETTPITPSSALGYNESGAKTDEKDYRCYWRRYNSNTQTSVVNGWTTVINTSIENVKSTIEGINNEVSTMRSKINTFDTTSSTFRNRAYSTYSTIVNNMG
ncbi:MAG: hypothetical protein LBH52_00115 [Puniceicoccales bacterium]|jgi:hypothetical protein|nr:hypothetical protein [Puniceicoccales bacterium]